MGGDVGGLGTTTDAYGAIAPASVGPWTTTTPLLAPLYNMNYLYNQGYFYLIGGSDNAGNATRTVESSLVNSSTGVMGPWSTTTQLPTGTFTEVNTAILSNNNIYIFGGANGAAGAPVITSTVYFAPITGPGTLGAWSTAASLPVGEYQYPTVLNAYGQIYILGDGANGSSFEASQSVSTGTLVSTTYVTGLT